MGDCSEDSGHYGGTRLAKTVGGRGVWAQTRAVMCNRLVNIALNVHSSQLNNFCFSIAAFYRLFQIGAYGKNLRFSNRAPMRAMK